MRGHWTLSVISAGLLRRDGMGGETLREGDSGDGRTVGTGEGREICDRRGGADEEMETGDEVAELNR